MILGRKTYELFVDFWPSAKTEQEIIADKLNSLNKIIVSNTLKQAPWGDFPGATIISENVVEAIKSLKQQEGKSLVVWGSISLSQLLIKEKIFDEITIQLCPTATGGGSLLFPDTSIYTNFKLVELKKYETGVVQLTYQPK